MKLKLIPETERIIYILGLILLGGFLLLFFLYHTGLFNPAETLPGCSFLLITGHYCPGCGGTRAVMALIQGDIISSLRWHPIVLYAGIWYLFFLGSHTICMFRTTSLHYKKEELKNVPLRKKRTFLYNKKETPVSQGFLSRIHGMKFRVSYVYIGLALLMLQWVAKNILNRPYLF